ncbi:hypothetical protein EDD86DRAFT_188570 [Gorgonomyces haynaldii]|nr:hypothetical protein EDD86DRAFT_188570 [Gorgonomyces haynaldii]
MDEAEERVSETGKDIWTLIKESKKADKKDSKHEEQQLETVLLFVGAKQCGKTTVINRFLDKEEQPNKTVALEYTFGRKSKNVNGLKDITHIWELAGGTMLSDIATIPITESNLHLCTLFVCLDLSAPQDIPDIVEHFIEKIKTHVNKIMDSLEARGSKRPKGLRSYQWQKFGTDHPDKDLVSLFPIPLMFLCTKADTLEHLESERKKLLYKMLRYLAHSHGASLLFLNQKDDQTFSKCKQALSHYAFKGTMFKSMQMDFNKPLAIIAGQDQFAQIGDLQPEQLDLSQFPEAAVDKARTEKEYLA